MSNLKALRSRIQTIKSTQKITSAMKLVASAHFRRAESRLSHMRTYAHQVEEAFLALLDPLDNVDREGFLFRRPSQKKHLLILIGSDRGLCGGFNVNLSRKANSIIADCQREGKEVSLLCVGSKSTAGLYPPFMRLIKERFPCVPQNMSSLVTALSSWIVQSLSQQDTASCSLVYTRFRSLMHTHVIECPLVAPSPKEDSQNYRPRAYAHDSKTTDILNAFSIAFIKARLYSAISESQASEQGARLMAMENATKNSQEILENLEILYNRVRQALITKELIEIVAGSENM